MIAIFPNVSVQLVNRLIASESTIPAQKLEKFRRPNDTTKQKTPTFRSTYIY